MTTLLFAVGGCVLGLLQAMLLARSTRQGPDPLSFFLRLLLVGTLLLGAARAAQLGPTAAAWAAGFASGTMRIARRRR